jgi:predicted RecB family endonuclease
MGRILDLLTEVAEWADEGPEDLALPPEAWDRLRTDWDEEDIEDALSLVRESLLHSDLVETADSLSCRLIEALGTLARPGALENAEAHGARLSWEVVSHLARRVDRLDEALQPLREGSPPDRRGFDALRARLADRGIEDAMRTDPPGDAEGGS